VPSREAEQEKNKIVFDNRTVLFLLLEQKRARPSTVIMVSDANFRQVGIIIEN